MNECPVCSRAATLANMQEQLEKARRQGNRGLERQLEKNLASLWAMPPGVHTCDQPQGEVPSILVKVGRGQQVHQARRVGSRLATFCGAENCSTGYRRFSAVQVVTAPAATCRRCLEHEQK